MASSIQPTSPIAPEPEPSAAVPATTPEQSRAVIPSAAFFRRPRRKGKGVLIFGLCLSLTLFVFAWRLLPPPSPAEVTITIISRQLSITRDVSLTALPGAVPAGQVQARFISGSSTVSTPTPVATTGSKSIPQIVAGGWITFYSLASTTRTVSVATILTASNGVQVKTLAQAVIPPASGNPLLMGQATVMAQATQAGTIGNLPAGAILTTCCSADGLITARNQQPFAGGQDGGTYLFVQQGDIDRQTALLEPEALQSARAVLASHMASGEQAVAGSQHCQSTTQASPPVGGISATVRVSVQSTCQQEVYQLHTAQQLASNDYSTTSQGQLGSSYTLLAPPQPGEPLVGVRDGSRGKLQLTFTIRGRWRYQLDQRTLAQLLPRIAGKPWQQAKVFLLTQPGIASVSISGGSVLPTDPQAIYFAL